MKRLMAVFAMMALLSPLAVRAQDHSMMPKGRWWKVPEVARQLELTAEQQDRLDAIFSARSKELIDLKATMDKSAIDLRAGLETFDSKPADVQKLAGAFSDARGRLFRKEIEMLTEMRGELSESQWIRLRTAVAERMSDRPPEQRRPMMQRPPAPGRRD
jgi:Spy/CpxP family protein refolding chaperone